MKNNFTSLYTYYPKYTKCFDDNSKRILDFKNNDTFAYNHFLRMLNRFFELHTKMDFITLCCVPNSKIYKHNNMIDLINTVCKNYDYLENGSEFIKCIKNRDSFCQSKIRSVKNFVDSINISDKVKNKEILLIDDVTTTGLSFMTTKTLLLNKGASYVDCLALAKTYH